MIFIVQAVHQTVLVLSEKEKESEGPAASCCASDRSSDVFLGIKGLTAIKLKVTREHAV